MARALALYAQPTPIPAANSGNPAQLPNPSSFTIPLSADQRNTIIAYSQQFAKEHPEFVSSSTVAGLTSDNDARLLQIYTGIYKIAVLRHATVLESIPVVGPAIQTTINSVTDFLQLLANGETWVRVGEFAAGLLLVGIGVHELAKGNSGYQKNVASPIKKTFKGAGIVSEVKSARNINKARHVGAEASRVGAEARHVRASKSLERAKGSVKK